MAGYGTKRSVHIKTTLRTSEETAPCRKEPFAPGYKPVYAIPKMGLKP